jgi:hypothetical protein
MDGSLRTSEAALSWESIQHCRVTVPHHVAHRRFAAETVLLNVQTGTYYGMDEIGSRFFDVLREVGDMRQAVATLKEEFQASTERIRGDMVRYCSELMALGLIELAERSD